MQDSNYTLLIEKLDSFIRKFYFNKLIRGVLYTTALLFAFFLIIALGEYTFYFSPALRKILFFGFIGTSLFAFVYLIIYPLLKIQKLGKLISHHQAAQIIGKHFSTVKDKLINILQLKTSEVSLEQAALIEASINQKAMELKPVPFTQAIDLNENRQYLKYAIPPFLVFVVLLFFKPNVIKESTNRLIQNDVVFEKPMPFNFIINSDSLEVLQFEDFRLDIKIEGEEIPNEIYLHRKSKNSSFTKSSPQKLNNTNYSYIFSNLQDDVVFYLEAGGYRSKDFEILVSQKPMITNFSIEMNYPKYLNKQNEVIKNSGDIIAPFGTSVKWIFNTIATEKINIKFSDASFDLKKENKNQFIYSKVLKNNDKYIVKNINKSVSIKDSVQFNISVVLDEYPKIEVKEHQDSTNQDTYFYIGEISDDYGLTNLTFNYKIENAENKNADSKVISKPIAFEKNLVSEFSHFWNVKQLGLNPGDKLSYYFQVWDNDGVNGNKSSRSRWMKIEIPSINEFENKTEKELDEIKKELTKSIEKTQEIQKDMKSFKEKLLNKKELSWEDKKQMEKMLSEQKKLQKNIENLNKKLKENIQKQSEYKEVNEDIAKKQEKVQKLFDEVLDEEMKALIEKYEEMLKELNKEEALEKTEEMEVNDQELEKELDRMLEMLKKLEFEQKMQETQEKLEKLAEKQEELANNEEKTTEEKKEEQEKINEEFEELKKDLEELEKLDEELGDNADMDGLKEDANDTSEDMEKATEQLDKNKEGKASESQKSAAEKMKDMAQKMSNMTMEMEAKSMEEDMESLRQLLENLISLSFQEEYLIDEFKVTSINTPKYVKLTQDQNKLIEDSKLVEDSLFALAKRVFQIESFVTEKIFDINRNLETAVKHLEERQVGRALVNQQYVMTGYNDLALMFSEVMEQMQAQMAKSMPGNQSCEKPGGNKPKPGKGKMPSLKGMQKQLSDQISKMGEQMKKDGKGKPGEGKPGSQSAQSKELAKMAAKQQAIREALQKIKDSDKKGEDGKGSLGDLQKIIDEMEQNETDIVNKNITNELIKRQQDIMTRLLEAETAERQRDEKEERKSDTVKDFKNETPPALKEYLNKRKSSLELYKNMPTSLKPYYRSISEKYFKNSTNN